MAPRATLVLVRHGEIVRPTETSNFDRAPLSKRGETQVATLAHHWPVASPEVVYTSDLLRSVQTGRILASILGAPLDMRPSLREWTPDPSDLDQGDYLELEARCWRDLSWRPPSGESLLGAQSRIARTLRDIARAHRGAVSAISGHGTLFSLFTAQLVGVPPARERKDSIPFASYAVVEHASRFTLISDFRVVT